MKKSFLLAIIAILASWQFAVAQQEAQFTQYMFNNLYYNPAYAGMDNGTRFQYIGRLHWLGYQTSSDGNGGIGTSIFSFNSPIQAINSGVGFHSVIEYLGPMRIEEYQLSLSHQIELGKGKLSIGIRPGIGGQTIDGNKLRARDANDPVLAGIGSSASAYRFDLGLGAMYQTKNYFVGLSASRLLMPKYDFGGITVASGKSFNNTAVPHIYLNGGYNFFLDEKWTLTPTFLARNNFYQDSSNNLKISTNPPIVDISLMVDYDKFIFGGFSFRTGSSDASLILGVNLLKDKNLRVIYAADLVTPGATVEATARSSHELGISYALPFVVRPPKPGVKTPRFRY